MSWKTRKEKGVLQFAWVLLLALFATGCANQELLNAQPQMVENNTAELKASETDNPHFYYVGFAADSTLSVFSNEIMLAKGLFDERFGSEGRSVVMLNSSQTMDNIPMATPENLNATLEDVAQKMDLEQDVLVLYISGHGGYNKGVKVNFWPHHSSWVKPENLRQELDALGFKWKVIVVSACFSGQFANQLNDIDTMVITASSPDRPSFGCTSSDTYTYFGDAYFNNQLPQSLSFEEAYFAAKEEITLKENQMGYPNSLPMLVGGKAIRDKLDSMFIQP